jgi:hypothetical protein
VYGAVAERRGEHLVHAAVLVEKRNAVEVGAHDGHLEVIPRAGSVLDSELGRAGKGSLEKSANGLGLHSGHASHREYAAEVRFVRALLFFELGFWSGTIVSALLLRRVFPSRGDEESDEIALVAILDGVALKSRSQAFRGGSMFSWLGGIAVDLREAQLAPGSQLEVCSVLGGIAIRVPPEWRVDTAVSALGGGVAVNVATLESEDAPTIRITGFSALGGIAIGAKPASS